MNNNFLEPRSHRKLNILRPIYFKKISAHRFVDLIYTRIVFSKKFSFKDLELLSRLQNQLFGRYFFPQKISFILFFKGDYLILI